jgi:hypothetical protein
VDVREILRIQLDYWMLERMLDVCGADVLQRAQGTVRSIVAIYAHAVIWEDMVVHTKLQGAPPVYALSNTLARSPR